MTTLTVALRPVLLLFLPLLLLATPVCATEPVPALTVRVTDQTATLNTEQIAALEGKLVQFERQKGTQIAVLIVPTTGDETIEQYGLRVAESWKLGRSKVDDGALLLVAKNDRTLRIEVGYGLEGALNDAVSKRIISEIIVPQFQAGDFYGGIEAGVDQMIAVADGEALPPPKREPGPGDLQGIAVVLLLAVVMLGSLFRALLGRLPGAVVTGCGAAILLWIFSGILWIGIGAGLVAFVLTLLGIGLGRGGMGGGFGGSSGGGFSGGGGGFGGGGASGKW